MVIIKRKRNLIPGKKLKGILKNLPSVEKVVIVEYVNSGFDVKDIGNAVLYQDFIASDPEPLLFDQLPFDHPLYILYSSGNPRITQVHCSWCRRNIAPAYERIAFAL
ncbi:MAG: hypothetical protein Ct9H300mP29_6250 [Candidatus Neomarinimicrobiota bacterium]|nr:MAG: hypothetical protein Ct9H300mP29_6250 [Candidatus Neomarinimicrobiota bacterium]